MKFFSFLTSLFFLVFFFGGIILLALQSLGQKQPRTYPSEKGTMLDEDEVNHVPRSISIPVYNTDQSVEVFTDELPEDASDLMSILKGETAPLDVWLQFAVRLFVDIYFMLFKVFFNLRGVYHFV
jgi:predicted PurR-regulated permease PerM